MFANPPNTYYERSSHSEFTEQSFRDSVGFSGTDPVPLPNSTSALPADPEFSIQYEIKGPNSAFALDQASMEPLLAGPQHGQSLDPTHGTSTLPSVQRDEPTDSPDKRLIIRKRPRSPQPTGTQRLAAVQRLLAKRTGVPEVSLGVMCFNTEPRPKRPRTTSQKQNKKDVQNGGGSCFLCLVYKKKVIPFKCIYLFQATAY